MKNQSRQENLIYLVVWSLLFATPLLSLYLRVQSHEALTFQWHEVFFIWGKLGIFLLLFLVHNFLLAPLLIHQQRRTLYFSLVVGLLVGFMAFQAFHHPRRMRPMGPPPHEMRIHKMRTHEMRPHEMPLVGERDIMDVVIMILLFGANIGIKVYVRTRKDHRKLELLEKKNLEQQLEYLKYQISPHFFMNTLNNIHALVDINPQKAQDTILELSKMMRFVLYEGAKSGVPLSKEFEFIRNYTRLMQLRYTDKVKISVDLPSEAPDKTIPPLMLISFIENAFKHGVSYQQASFISIKADVDLSQLHFFCQNSKAEKPNEEKGGVGLVNVKKRLDLLYDHRYTLDIKDEENTYTLQLTIPL